MPMVESLMTFGSQVNPLSASYYTNLTGFWRGDVAFHNLTRLESNATTPPPSWHHLADSLVASANLTNATEFTNRLGNWNWTRSDKVAISFGDKLMWSKEDHKDLSKDIAIIHVRLSYVCACYIIDIETAYRARLTLRIQRAQRN